MNKTVKTIAWICLVLGIMGILLDAGIILHLGRVRAERQAAIEAGEIHLLKPGIPQLDEDDSGERELAEPEDKDGDFDLPRPRAIPQEKADRIRGILQGRRAGLGMVTVPNRMPGQLPFLAMLFFGAGPVLAIIGAVTLIVNRESTKKVETEELPEEKKDTKKTRKNQ